MVPLNQLTEESILSDEVLSEVFDQEDEIYKARLLLSLEDRAAELGKRREFQEMVKAYKRVERELKRQRREKREEPAILDNWTNFTDSPYDRMQCKNWIATDEGVFIRNPNPGAPDIQACYHPILPVERLKNLETGKEQIKLAYKRNGSWKEIIIPKGIITSQNKIVSLSELGISVTSENAKYLVKYLADVENLNDDYINIQYSSSKLGWIGDGFLPYDNEIVFDGDIRFRQQFEAIQEHGNREAWYSHVRDLRRSGRIELKFMLASSFASVLVNILGGLPFFVDLWGETEGGKTVTLMLAASVWANPAESRYIGDFKTTDVALEAKADMLNNLPMILDDTSKVSARIKDNFEGVVYDLCSGKGKSRSNKDLGINRENRWNLAILTNGERPLQSYVTQGGAINRILEVECGEKVYKDPQNTASTLKKNYGFAGKDFVKVIKEIGVERIKEINQDLQRQLFSDSKMQKQSIALSIVLTADRIITDYLFKDGGYISIDEARQTLIDRNEVSDNERCYRYLVDKVIMNEQRFDYDTHCEKWGVTEKPDADHDYMIAIFHSSAFEQLCQDGGFSKKSFLSWAKKKDLIITENGRSTKIKSIGGAKTRCVFLKIVDDIDRINAEKKKKTDEYDVVFN